MHRMLALTLILFTISCGAITRDDILQQKIIVKDSSTKKPIPNVIVTIDNTRVGKTDNLGVLKHTLSNPNEKQTFTLHISHANYTPINIPITSKAGGSYVAGGVALFLLGIVPGVVSLGVDGGTGTWYTYDKKITLYMTPK